MFYWIHEKYSERLKLFSSAWIIGHSWLEHVTTSLVSILWKHCKFPRVEVCVQFASCSAGWRDYCEREYKTEEMWVKGSPHKCPGVFVLFSQAFKSLFIHNPKTRVYVGKVTCFSLNDFPKQMLLLELFELINNKIMLPLLRFH